MRAHTVGSVLIGLVVGWAQYAATFDPAAPLQVTFGSSGMGSFVTTSTRKKGEEVRLVTRPDLCGKAGLGMPPLEATSLATQCFFHQLYITVFLSPTLLSDATRCRCDCSGAF